MFWGLVLHSSNKRLYVDVYLLLKSKAANQDADSPSHGQSVKLDKVKGIQED